MGFGDFHGLPERTEDGFDGRAIGGAEWGSDAPAGDACADLAGRVGHRAYDVARLREYALQARDFLSGENREHEFPVCQIGECRVSRREVLGFERYDQGVGAGQELDQ